MECPADPFAQTPFRRGSAAGLSDNRYARGSYAINVGPDGDCINNVNLYNVPCVGGFSAPGGNLLTNSYAAWGSGIAGANRCFSLADIADGASQTVAVNEVRAGLDESDPRGVWALGQIGSSVLARHGRHSDAGGPNPEQRKNSDEFIGCDAVILTLGSEYLRKQRMPCLNVPHDGASNLLSASRSLHAGGVHVLLADGSTHFASNQMDIEIWHALHTRGHADNVGDPF